MHPRLQSSLGTPKTKAYWSAISALATCSKLQTCKELANTHSEEQRHFSPPTTTAALHHGMKMDTNDERALIKAAPLKSADESSTLGCHAQITVESAPGSTPGARCSRYLGGFGRAAGLAADCVQLALQLLHAGRCAAHLALLCRCVSLHISEETVYVSHEVLSLHDLRWLSPQGAI